MSIFMSINQSFFMRVIYRIITMAFLVLLCFSCKEDKAQASTKIDYLEFSETILDYRITPKDALDKSGLMFSDQGAWFAYGFPDSTAIVNGFSGPFLMTQQNGIWSTSSLSRIRISVNDHPVYIKKENIVYQHSYASHLEQNIDIRGISLKERLLFLNGNTEARLASIFFYIQSLKDNTKSFIPIYTLKKEAT